MSTAGTPDFCRRYPVFQFRRSPLHLAPPGVPLTFYAVVFGLDLISSYGNDDIQQKYIHRQTSGELLFQTVFHPKNPGTEPLRQSLEAIRSLYQEDFSSHELLIKAELLRIWHYLCRYPATQAFSVYPKDDSKILLTKKILPVHSGAL